MAELETSIVDISEDFLDTLFDETPNKTVNADSLLGGKKGIQQQATSEDNIEDEDEVEEEDIRPAQKRKAVPKQPKIRPEAVIEQLDDDFDPNAEEEPIEEDEEAEEEIDEKPKKKKVPEKAQAAESGAEDEDKVGVTSILKSTVDYLVQEGLWDDFDNRESMDIDEETYAKLVREQDSRRVQSMFEEMVDSTGSYGKAIIDFIKNGGNPDEVIDLFKEQKQVDSMNIETLDGQKGILRHYYTEVMGWKQERADKYINNLVLSNEIESESQEVKELFNSYYQKEVKRLSQDREAHLVRQKEAEEAFENNIRSAIKERRDLTPTERRLVEDQLLRYDQKLPNGNMVNKFYVNFAKMQANPADYVELVLFVNDKQKYTQKVASKEKTEAAAQAFKFIKGNGAVSAKKGSGYEQIRKNDKISGFDWGLPSK